MKKNLIYCEFYNKKIILYVNIVVDSYKFLFSIFEKKNLNCLN